MGRKTVGNRVFKWPEFLALCERLEVDLTLPTRRITISVGLNEAVEIQQDFLGRDAQDEGD